MESTQPARRATAAAASPELDRRDQERAAKEATDKEIAERLSSPPPQPEPTQAEADALKSGEALEGDGAQAREARQARDVKPAASGAGYTTR